jgi:hypothetical protein
MNIFSFIVAYRGWGNRISLAKKLVAVFPLIWLVILSHRLIWYGVFNGGCGGQAGFYAYFDNIFDAIVTCLLPMVTLTVLGVLIERSVRRIAQRRVVPTVTANESAANANQSAIRKIDAQLSIMLFMNIVVAVISFLPYAAQLIYTNITQNWSKSPSRVAWENVIMAIINLLSYIFFSSPFYVSIVAFSGLRQQLLRTLRLTKQQTNARSTTQQGVTMKTINVKTRTAFTNGN